MAPAQRLDEFRLASRAAGGPLGGEPGLEQQHQPRDDVGVRGQRRLDVALPEGQAGLAQPLHVGAHDGDLAPVEAGQHHQGAEAVVLGLAAPHRADGVGEPLGQGAQQGELHGGDGDAEVVDPGRRGADPLDLVGPLVDDGDAHVLQDREHLGQQQPLAHPVDAQAALAERRAGRRPQPQGQLTRVQAVEPLEVGDGLLGGEVLLVGGREGVGHPGEHLLGLGAVPGGQCVAEIVGPAAGGGGELGLQRLDVDRHRLGGAALGDRHADDEVQPGQHRLRGSGRVLDARAAQPLQQQLLHGQPHLGRVPVPRQVDQRRPEPAGRVAAQEQPGLAPLLQVLHGQRDRQQLVGADLQQLVARIGLEDLEQLLAGVAVERHPGAGDDLFHPPPHERHVEHAAGVGGRREQPDEAVLPGAVLAREADGDQVQPGPAVHRRPGVGLGDGQQVVPRGAGRLGEPDHRGGHVGVAAQDSLPGAGDGAGRGLAAALHQVDVAGAQEDEVAVGQPAQQGGGLGRVVGGIAPRRPGSRPRPARRAGRPVRASAPACGRCPRSPRARRRGRCAAPRRGPRRPRRRPVRRGRRPSRTRRPRRSRRRRGRSCRRRPGSGR